MRSIKLKKTFVFRVALASVISLLMSFSTMCYTNHRVEALESRLYLIETNQQSEALGKFDLKLETFNATESAVRTVPTAEDVLRELQADQFGSRMGMCESTDCVDF